MPFVHGKPPFLPGLGGLRALAALAVLLGHAVAWLTPLPDHPGLYAPLARLTHCGLSAFFVLSGFVLQYTHGTRLSGPGAVARFALARLARLYPVYLLLLLVELARLLIVAPGTVMSWPGNVAATFTLTQSWFFLPEAPAIFPLAWAISTEAFFYCLFPLAARVVGRLERPAGAVWLACGCVLGAVAVDAAIAGHWPRIFAFAAARHPGFAGRADALAGQLFQWLTYVNPGLRFFEFLLGAATARLFLLRPGPLPGLAPAAVACLAGLLLVPVPKDAFFWSILEDNILYAPFLAALCHAWAARPPALATGRTLARIGAASLSVYLIQPFVLPHLKSEAALARPWAAAALALAGMAAVLWCGLALSRFVEAPLARCVLSLGRRDHSGNGARGKRPPSAMPPGDAPPR